MAEARMLVRASFLPRFSPALSSSLATRLASTRAPPRTMTHLAAALVRSFSPTHPSSPD
jgi:hypothetical protein